MTTATEVERTETYKMPSVCVGDEVLLVRGDNDVNACPGKVTKVTPRAISVFHFGTRREFRGVRHVLDPELKTRPDIIQDSGAAWQKSRNMERLEQLEDRIKSLESQLERISAKAKRD